LKKEGRKVSDVRGSSSAGRWLLDTTPPTTGEAALERSSSLSSSCLPFHSPQSRLSLLRAHWADDVPAMARLALTLSAADDEDNEDEDSGGEMGLRCGVGVGGSELLELQPMLGKNGRGSDGSHGGSWDGCNGHGERDSLTREVCNSTSGYSSARSAAL
jgi:hypothetical protein